MLLQFFWWRAVLMQIERLLANEALPPFQEHQRVVFSRFFRAWDRWVLGAVHQIAGAGPTPPIPCALPANALKIGR
jgi:hypothetical protein